MLQIIWAIRSQYFLDFWRSHRKYNEQYDDITNDYSNKTITRFEQALRINKLIQCQEEEEALYIADQWKSISDIFLHQTITNNAFVVNSSGLGEVSSWGRLSSIVEGNNHHPNDKFHEWALKQLKDDPYMYFYYISLD